MRLLLPLALLLLFILPAAGQPGVGEAVGTLQGTVKLAVEGQVTVTEYGGDVYLELPG